MESSAESEVAEQPAGEHGETADDRWTRWRAVAKHFGTLDFLLPALIGAISLSMALFTWLGVSHIDEATVADRDYVLQRSLEQGNLVRANVDVGGFRDDLAYASADLRLADHLEAAAGLLASNDPARQSLENEIEQLRRAGRERVAFDQFVADESGYPEMDSARTLDELFRRYQGENPARPAIYGARATQEQHSARRLSALIVWLAVAGVIATAGHVIRHRPMRIGLCITSTSVWIATCGVMLMGGG